MLRDVLIVLAMVALPVVGGLAVGELAYRLALMRHFGLRYNRGRDRHMRECKALADRTFLGPLYTVVFDGETVLKTHNSSEALRATIGRQGARVYKDGVLVVRNRTLVQGGGKS